MDQDPTNSTDKRNWRERLGIGKNGAGSELPKIASEFEPAPAKKAAASPTKPAPMAPRIAPRPATGAAPSAAVAARPAVQKPTIPASRPATPSTARPAAPAPAVTPVARPASVAPRTPPVSADALAAKLKEQRDAAEKLAIQRVASAKQKIDGGAGAGNKPKFSFADSEPPPVQVPRPAVAVTPPPVLKPTLPPSAAPAPYSQPNYPTNLPQGYPAGFNQQAPAGYRPIDPATGFAQPPAFQPRAPQPQQAQLQPALRPNLNQSFRPASPSGFQGQSFQPRASVPQQPRMPQMPMPQSTGQGPRLTPIAQDDVFEDAPPPRPQRRATAKEYQQAYSDDLSDGFENERPRALGWILTLLLLTALAVAGGYYYLQNKSPKVASSGQPVAVEAPTTPVKVPAEQPATPTAPLEQAGKKLIYDRIEGDKEVPGGPLKSSEQAPNPQGVAPSATGNGGAIPLPLPPPPAANGKQGALDNDGKNDIALITPAAEQSSAANSSDGKVNSTSASATADSLPMPTGADATNPPAAPAQAAAIAAVTAAASAAKPTSTASAEEVITPVKKEPTKKIAPKPVAEETSATALGANPVVLVAPSAPIAPVARTLSQQTTKLAAVATAKPAVPAATGIYGDLPAAAPVAPAAPANIAKAQAAAAPTPQPVATNPGFQVQLASFASKSEATTEYQRLAAKHGAIITRYAPLIEQAQVAGSTRYRLNLGPMATNDVAQSVCASLISAGERDCLVRR